MKNSKKLLLCALLILPVLGVFVVTSSSASAATINVTTTADEDSNPGTGCSIFEASEAADNDTAYGGCTAGSGSDTVNIPAGTYTIFANYVQFEMSVTILGDTDGGTILEDGQFGISVNQNDSTYLARDITVRNSNAVGFNISGNQADEYNVTLDRITSEGNTDNGVTHSRDQNATGQLYITNSIIRNNQGIGLYNYECGVSGSIYVTNSAIEDNLNGGIYNQCGDISLNRVTISGNSSDTYAGGIENGDNGGSGYPAAMDLTNVTIYGNTSTSSIGGIYSVGDMTFTNVTISRNDGVSVGGFEATGGEIRLYNTLIAENIGLECSSSLGSQVVDSSSNLTDACDIDDVFIANYNVFLDDALSDNGGTASIGSGGLEGNVLTLALLEGSRAIDAGDDTYCPAIDERDADRPDGNTCDIGAYESAFSAVWTVGGPSSSGSDDEETLAESGFNTTIIAVVAVAVIATGAVGLIKVYKRK